MKHTAIITLAALAPMVSVAESGYVTIADKGVAVGTSVTGDKVYGYNGRSGNAALSTWIFDINTKETQQFTEYAEGVADTGGQVAWINSQGTMAGAIRDMDWVAPYVNGENYDLVEDYPLSTACIWKDGALIKLDHNRWSDPATFKAQDGTLPSLNNGFYAMQISDDESTVVGYLKAFTYMLPVRWTRDAEGNYVSTMLTRQTGEFFYTWVGATADCSRVIMNTSQSGGSSYIWDGDAAPKVFTYQEQDCTIEEPVLTALSPSGRYAIMRCYRDGKAASGVYDFEAGELKWIPVPEGASSANWFAANVVTDRADGFICDYNYRLHYFNMDLGINIPFSSYTAAYGADITAENGGVPAKAIARMVSADGRTICGNTLTNSLEDTGWILRLPDTKPMLFALSNCQALFTPALNLTVKWRNPELPDGASIQRYIIKVDGESHVITDAETSADGYTRTEVPCSGGEHSVEIYAVATDKDGKEWESVHQTIAVNISSDTSLYFFEDLDDSTIDATVMAYIYAHDTFQSPTPDDSGALSFRLDAGDFYNLTPFWYTCGFSNAEWHTYLESRWFDATDTTEDMYFTWHERNMPINSATRLDATNRLRLEYTTDGENWQPLNETDGETNAGKWTAHVVDLSALCGHSFRLRFHAIGGGKYACEWRIDYYGIKPASCMYEAPEGLMVTSDTPQQVSLAWKNNRGEYEVSYNYNSPMTYNQNVGNEGRDLYVACDYGSDKFKAFEGKYITSVSTMLYEPADAGQDWHTTVEALVFDQDGNVLSKGTLSDDAPWYDGEGTAILPIHHIDLDTPVLIEADKTYRVSIKISNYVAEMCPIWYFSASDDYIPGVTDLYSDDDLASWHSFSDLIDSTALTTEEFNTYGRCIFNIRPCISDQAIVPTCEYEQTQWFYQVYRDGELLPHGIAYYTQQSVTDTKSEGCSWTVRSFRRDGSVSQMSAPLVYQEAGIRDITIDPASEITVLKTDNGYVVTGDFDKVSVYTASGIKVSDSAVIDTRSLPHGFYVIVAEKHGKTISYKIGF